MGKAFFHDEVRCTSHFDNAKPFWHLYTSGLLSGIIFSNDDDFIFGMNLLALCADKFPQLKIYTFALMSNHVHVIFSGDKAEGERMFELFRSRLKRYLTSKERVLDWNAFSASWISIDDLQALRNEIVYTNRNGYLAHNSYLPHSYPWGAGYLYFNPICYNLLNGKALRDCSVDDRRKICHSKDISVSTRLLIKDQTILPSSFCYVKEGEALFRHPHHYFYLLTKNWEAYSQIAKRMSDSVFLSDEEMYATVCSMCITYYNVKRPDLLSAPDKVDMARRMHSEYNASNKQIRRILKLELSQVETLFPKPSGD